MPALSASSQEAVRSVGAADWLEFALFKVAAYRFGIEVSVIREIVNPLPVTPLPGSESFVQGLVNLRGRIVTLVDLGTRFGEPAVTRRAEYNIVVVENGERTCGLAVDEIIHIARIPPSEVTSSREALDRVGFSSPDIRGAGEVDDRLFYVLDTDAIFSSTFA